MRLLDRWTGDRGRRKAPRGALAALFAGLPEAALWLDPGWQVRDANAALRLALGPALPVRPGMAADRLFDGDSQAAFAAWQAGGPAPAELCLAAPEGAKKTPVAPHRIALPGGDGVLLLQQDVAQRQALAARLAEADRLQALGTLAGGIAHDFNNLLTVVLGATDDALRLAGPQADPALAAELAQVQAAARRGAALVQQMLAYARQQVLAPRLVSLNGAVEGMASLLRPLLGRGISLELELDQPGRPVLIDPSELDRVLMNLAMNARQAMPQGGRLTLRTRRALLLQPEPAEPEEIPPGRWTVLEVEDTGTGIPPGLLPRIFEPFFTGRAQQGGTGLGLATVHGILRQSGGFITVRSRAGQGTCFRILLPRVEEAARRPPAIAASPAVASESAAPGLLLLVEDEAPLRRLAERALRRAGWVVEVAEDAEAALALIDSKALAPALLVSDVIMPGMDGAALARLLRPRFPAMAVLLVSGYAPSMVEEGLAGAGAPHFLAKPYAPAELVARARAILQGAVAPAGG
ncbi:ATP-binding protein [Roseomonas sp. 18066]|uniref:ATP-binding protein n=1 Tax=Roseomonas sp. 18066 TaxID=2681412 RepID=UPI001F304A6F|nr:ATP-binding protein [Roseomonas sp. 18066]